MKIIRIDSLQTRLSLILLSTLLLPAALIAWFAYDRLVDTVKAERIKTVGRVADARHEQLTMVFQRAIVRAQGFLADQRGRCANLPASTGCGLQELHAFVRSEGALGAVLNDPAGGSLAVGDPAVPTDEPAILPPGQLAQFTSYAAGAARKYFIPLADPASGMQLVITYPVRLIQPIFETHRDLGKSGENFLSDKAGYFITSARYPSEQGHSHPISATPMLRCLTPENAETLDLDYRSVAIIHGFRFIPEIGGGCIMAHIDQAEAFAPIEALQKQFILAMLIFSVLALAAARYFASRIAKPITRLASVTRSIAAGDLAARATPAGYQEVAELATAFNAMTDQLAAVNAGLEQRVEERTAALSESDQRFRQLFNAGSDAIFVAERLPDGRPGKLIEVNDIACERLGYSREELLRMTPDEIDSPAHGSASDPEFLRKLDEVRQATIERVHVAKDGHQIPVEINVQLITLADKEAILGVARDITERKAAGERLEQALLSAQAATRTKSEFLANMSHEIRTPMNAIIGLSDLALGLDIPPRLRDYCSKIQTSSKALLSILNGILDYSKIEAGRLELDEIEFSLEKLLENVSDLFIVHAEGKGLELFFEATHVPPLLIGDPLRLGQVMNNLVGNAVKFTERGEVHVKVETVALDGEYANLRFSVRDTGIGMTAEQTERLFQAFTQADGSITRKYGGTGLGLTISKGLVEEMGGTISVLSEPAQGSTFSFTISLRVAQAAVPARSPANLRGMRVLVVDDSETSRQILREILTSWKFVVAEAASGQQALQILSQAKRSETIELLLLDWKMPGMDGIELARQVQERVQRGEIAAMPVSIMVTAYGKDKLLQEAQGVRLDAVLQKPVIASNLFDTIIAIQGGKTAQTLPPAGGIATPLAGVHVLLVEDNEINQQVARELLERAGLFVSVASNGEEALHALQTEKFAAVLMDLQMPVMDGFEATRRIRQDARFHDLPILALSAAVMAEDRAACLAAGMNDHVAKPLVPQEMLETLEKWIRPGGKDAALCTVVAIARNAAQAMPRLPGFELEAALDRVGGKRMLLEKLLLKFAEQFAQAADELAALLQAGRTDEAAALVHLISSTAGNLGAVAVHAAANRLERELRENAPPDARQELNVALTRALESIATITVPPNPELFAFECAKCRWERGTVLLKELRGLLQNSDFVAPELIVELIDSVDCQLLHRQLLDLRRQIEHIDYQQALETLGSITCAKGHDFSGR